MLVEVTDKEVKSALFNMDPYKSPGPDGMSPCFFQKHWHIVGGDIVHIVKQFFESRQIDQQLQHINIVLIPKKKNHSSMTDLRPISLCCVIYKVISKVLANRLKLLIDLLISDS